MCNRSTSRIIIGAGIGGLSAAIHLAVAGERVLVLEKNDQTGGKMAQMEAEGFRWDTGPSVITMRWVLEALFQRAGRRLEDFLTLLPLTPLTRYFYPDGSRLDVDADPHTTARSLAEFAPGDAQGYLDFLDYANSIHEATGDAFIYGEPPSWRSFFRTNPLNMMRADAFRTMQEAIERFVGSPQARQLLGRFATYTGASPYLAPATLNVIAHVELNQGVWYPQGGIYTIAQALTALATQLGVEIRTGCPVDRIELTEDRVAAVHTAHGERIPAQAVIANVDVTHVHTHLLPQTQRVRRERDRLHRLAPSSSGMVLLLAVERAHPQLAHHNIFFSPNYAREFHQIFEQEVPPQDPTIYIAITSKTDPNHAPPGCENWFVLVNTPPVNPRFDWEGQAIEYRDRILQRLAHHFQLDVRDHLRWERGLTPLDLAGMTAAHRGALYGQSSNQRMAAFRRPHNRSRAVQGLYFAGGTTHPGGGVPMVILSGKAAAKMLLADQVEG